MIFARRRLGQTRPRAAGSRNVELSVGVGMCMALALMVVLAPWLTAHEPDANVLENRLQSFGAAGHWLGTDHLGRDIWSRLLAGLVWSTSAAVSATLISLAIGAILGLSAAGSDGWPRATVRWFTDTVIAFPGLIVAVCVIAIIGQGWLPMVLTLGFLGWPVFARVTYAEALSLMQRSYVTNARLQGVSRRSILGGHVLPGIVPTLLAMTAFNCADMLIAESALSFLGIGAPLGAPTWGNMLAEARQYLLRAPWLVFAPGLAIVVVVVAANLLGDGLTQRYRQKGPAPLL